MYNLILQSNSLWAQTLHKLFISCFCKLSWGAYENKLKATYGDIISYFNKLFQILTEEIIS